MVIIVDLWLHSDHDSCGRGGWYAHHDVGVIASNSRRQSMFCAVAVDVLVRLGMVGRHVLSANMSGQALSYAAPRLAPVDVDGGWNGGDDVSEPFRHRGANGDRVPRDPVGPVTGLRVVRAGGGRAASDMITGAAGSRCSWCGCPTALTPPT